MDKYEFEDGLRPEVLRNFYIELSSVNAGINPVSNTAFCIEEGSDVLDVIQLGFNWAYSRCGAEYWTSMCSMIGNSPEEIDIEPVYTRQPTRKRIKCPLWARIQGGEK